MSEKKIIFIEEDIETAKKQVFQTKANFEGQDIIIIGGVGTGRSVLFPEHITMDDTVVINSKDIPLSELVKTLDELEAQKGLTDIMRNMKSTIIEPLPQYEIPFIKENNKSSFIPQRGGDNRAWKKGKGRR